MWPKWHCHYHLRMTDSVNTRQLPSFNQHKGLPHWLSNHSSTHTGGTQKVAAVVAYLSSDCVFYPFITRVNMMFKLCLNLKHICVTKTALKIYVCRLYVEDINTLIFEKVARYPLVWITFPVLVVSLYNINIMIGMHRSVCVLLAKKLFIRQLIIRLTRLASFILGNVLRDCMFGNSVVGLLQLRLQVFTVHFVVIRYFIHFISQLTTHTHPHFTQVQHYTESTWRRNTSQIVSTEEQTFLLPGT